MPAGWVAGCKQVGKGYVNGELKIHLIHPQQIHPQAGAEAAARVTAARNRPSTPPTPAR